MDDVTVRAIIPRQSDHLRTREVDGELVEETDVRSTETINGLIRVANRTDVSVRRHE